MNRDDIIRWARSAIRLSADDASLMGFDQEATILDRYEFLHWFAKEAAAAEREACAKTVEIFDKTFQTGGGIAGSIRARGKV